MQKNEIPVKEIGGMVKKFDALIIGTGQAGPSLANRLSQRGKQVVVVERARFGGTCVNTGCTPTKALVANAKIVHSVHAAPSFGVQVSSFKLDMPAIKARKDAIVHASSSGLEEWLRGMKGCTLVKGHATFIDPHTVSINGEHLEAERIFINVGSRPAIPNIPGLKDISFLTNASIMNLDFVPEHLLIIGGGYIALEFAQMYRRFGSCVTVIQRNAYLMPKEDSDVSEEIKNILEKDGIRILTGIRETKILEGSKEGNIRLSVNLQEITGTHLLVATGRVPNTDDLGLEKAGVTRDTKGFIKVNDQLQTSQPHIWALGDCNGQGAFTHTSYNDYEIVADNLLNGDSRRISDRISIYALYIDPPLGRVGMTEREAKKSGKHISMAKMPMSRVARAREKSETDGFMKIIVDTNSKQILGASLLGIGCDEVVQMIANVIYAKAPYTSITRGVHIHPTVSELIPTLLEGLQTL
jgi:pyruvate/2-oxoglutarate dehydrogenase complex dihydrolipoamide dehydrogenase (E3) component